MTNVTRKKTGRMKRKISLFLSLMAIVSLVLMSSGHSMAKGALMDNAVQSSTCMHVEPGDHENEHLSFQGGCKLQSCSYCYPLSEELGAAVLIANTLEFTQLIKLWQPLVPGLRDRPPRLAV